MNSFLSILRHPRFKKIISISLLVYLSGALLLYFFQDNFIFRARALAATYTFSATIPHREITVPVNDHDTLHAVLYLPGNEPAKGTVVYFHGNRYNISWYEKFVPYFTQRGYEVLMPDYPGYGKSKGVITEEKLYHWATLVYQIARKRYSADSLIIYGKSLGTGIAAELASRRDCKQLILETPYYQFPAVLQRFLPMYPVSLLLRYQLPTYRYLTQVAAPVTLLHGTNDGVIAFSQSRQLEKLFKKQDRLIVIEGGSHNDLYDFTQTTEWLTRALQ